MKCPIDGAELQMSERQGVEIDYCPQCRGVWLDRGELDKIIDRISDVQTNDGIPSLQHSSYPKQHEKSGEHYGKHGRRKSLLGELFDF